MTNQVYLNRRLEEIDRRLRAASTTRWISIKDNDGASLVECPDMGEYGATVAMGADADCEWIVHSREDAAYLLDLVRLVIEADCLSRSEAT